MLEEDTQRAGNVKDSSGAAESTGVKSNDPSNQSRGSPNPCFLVYLYMLSMMQQHVRPQIRFLLAAEAQIKVRSAQSAFASCLEWQGTVSST